MKIKKINNLYNNYKIYEERWSKFSSMRENHNSKRLKIFKNIIIIKRNILIIY